MTIPAGRDASLSNLRNVIKGASAIVSVALMIAAYLSEHATQAATWQAARTSNPVSDSEQNVALGLDHFEAHCARCHGTSGKAHTEMGKRLRAADLTSDATQSKADDELFRTISNGIPTRGMPAFGKSHEATEIWQTILFLRRLPSLTDEKRSALKAAIPEGARHKHETAKPESDPRQTPQTGQQKPAQQEHQHAAPAGAERKEPQPPSQSQPHASHSDAPKTDQQHAGHGAHEMSAMMQTISGGPFKSMHAMGSGTSLMPASTPGHMWMWIKGDWNLMLHGDLKLVFNHQGGPRGVNKAESHNWLMLMAERPAGGGRLMMRGMFSAEPWTTPTGGFPQLFQTGETFKGRPIIDAQHAHDLLMELAASYTLPLSEHVSISLYGGPVGEPALGPVAFMHRASASENVAAPLGHHWQDSTHITHGVFTAGLTAWRFRFEGSIFRGSEPDENRKDLEMGKLDSYSGRIWFTPAPNWSLQFSAGHLTQPEALEPGDLQRITASISHNRTWPDGSWATSLIWGRNREEHGNSNSYLLESNLNFLDKNYLFTRLELVDKPGLLEENVFGRRGLDEHHENEAPGMDDHFTQWFRIGAFSFGGVRDVVVHPKYRFGIGGQLTFYHLPGGLKPIYGSSPTSFHFFLRFRPGKMAH